ncbi:MAG: monovalent cation/H(+) antiporter subunit G [Propionibacteriaceae bacterium]|nr:monovalent cation/H(+) antiporter subunit G [Propionibacteriaceae bacterium]
MDVLIGALVTACVVIGSLFVLAVAVAFFKERDAISRINALGPATALGLPLIVTGAYIEWTWQYGFSGWLTFKSLATICALVLVSSVASNVLARAAYASGTPLDPRTAPNDLAEEPQGS